MRCWQGFDLGLGFFLERGLVAAAEQQTFVVQGADLPVQGAGAPVLRSGFVHVPVTGFRVCDTQQGPVMGPAQFGTHCVPNRKTLEKGAHVAQVALVKAFAEIAGQRRGQARQQSHAIGRAGGAGLLELDDVAPDFPAGLHLHHVHRAQRALAALVNELLQCMQQGGQGGIGRRALRLHARASAAPGHRPLPATSACRSKPSPGPWAGPVVSGTAMAFISPRALF
jgi:hypothetical protein